jgi:hypothetical protein
MPPTDTIKFAELAVGTKGTDADAREKSVVDPLKDEEKSSRIIEFPIGYCPVTDAEFAGTYPRAFVTSEDNNTLSSPFAFRKLVAVAPVLTNLRVFKVPVLGLQNISVSTEIVPIPDVTFEKVRYLVAFELSNPIAIDEAEPAFPFTFPVTFPTSVVIPLKEPV